MRCIITALTITALTFLPAQLPVSAKGTEAQAINCDSENPDQSVAASVNALPNPQSFSLFWLQITTRARASRALSASSEPSDAAIWAVICPRLIAATQAPDADAGRMILRQTLDQIDAQWPTLVTARNAIVNYLGSARQGLRALNNAIDGVDQALREAPLRSIDSYGRQHAISAIEQVMTRSRALAVTSPLPGTEEHHAAVEACRAAGAEAASTASRAIARNTRIDWAIAKIWFDSCHPGVQAAETELARRFGLQAVTSPPQAPAQPEPIQSGD